VAIVWRSWRRIVHPPDAGQAGEFADHFSSQAQSYAKFRPRYPTVLFHYLAVRAPGTVLAWDCGTGNGQAAVGVAERFARVVATDPSEAQISRAIAHPRVEYRVARYDSGIAPHTAQLVTVAQALHWMDPNALVAEARRVLQPGGLLAAWCYSLCRIEGPIDELVEFFYRVTVGAFWPPERRLVDEGYRSVALPIDELDVPPLDLVAEMTFPQFLGYVETWSAVQRCIAVRGRDTLDSFARSVAERWGAPSISRRVTFPLHVRAGELR
jgi:SAM-dependent methyltransferase